ncbi:LOW QUALITY PROTEIN: pentatricopeptide repeat-containing protein At2g36730-like [Cajanus cajan]|uniref:LOW QUALITY PROTEIN: pentatricopeptide repeat-containing protein At2g36730-like n=1 Tax=Cajanus cajan TaxID=3821 RepID=UPI00098DA388|nr:LOW QUALITY PROTEIN: pentatricopeptide repeat-containing protein At2g36730-like [Cajanus cajan]
MVRLPIPKTQSLSKKQQCLFLLNSCRSMDQLLQIQTQIHVSGLYQDTHILSQLVYFCSLSPSNNLHHARTLVHYSATPSPISWNILIRGYAVSGSHIQAFWVFRKMRERGVMPNKLTFPFLIKCCAASCALNEGKQVHANTAKCGLDSDVYVGNNLINFYGCCKKIVDARKVFEEMPDRTVVSWNSVMTACVESCGWLMGLGIFFRMRGCGFEPDETSMVVVLSACAELGYLSLGRWVHSLLVLRGVVFSVQLGTALVDMYGKSGALGYARAVFERMGKRNVWTWSAMILGLAQHGFAEEALKLFAIMSNGNSNKNNHDICPNYVTYLGVLCACSHAGMVNEGYRYFHEMERVHGIKPLMTHYGAMVDILGHAGRLREAYEFVESMPIEPDPVVWRTLLSACTVHDVHDHAGIGERGRKRLLGMELRRGGNLVIIANIYAEVGKWEEVANVRRVMRDVGVKKIAGESCVDLGGSMRRFFAGYDPCPDLMPVYHVLDGLNLHLKMVD